MLPAQRSQLRNVEALPGYVIHATDGLIGTGEAPPYDAARQLDRLSEQGIHEHHGRSVYWAEAGD